MYFISLQLLNVLVLVHVTFERSAAQSDCSNCCDERNYKAIDEPRRSIRSTWKAGQKALCDINLPWGWYRFTSFTGGEMPTSVVDPNHCGTVAPVWIKGKNPSEQDGTVNRKACVNFFGLKNGCAQSSNIKVRNCSSYYVYFLRPTYSCAIAYCAGTKEPCPYGKVGRPGNCVDPPVQFDMSLIREPQIVLDPLEVDHTVNLLCKADLVDPSMQSWKNVSYRFTWFMEGKHILTDDICGPLDSGSTEYDSACPGKPLFSRLEGSRNHYQPNRLISCNVTARYTTSTANIWSTPKAVAFPFFAGIKVEPTVLTLRSCALDKAYLTITPTIPIRNSSYANELHIGFWLPAGIRLDNHNCQIKLKELNSVTVNLIAGCSNLGSRHSDKLIYPEIENAHSRFWSRAAHIPAIWVSVIENSDIGYCKAYMDPHYQSFL